MSNFESPQSGAEPRASAHGDPELSIVMACYNASAFLEGSAASALSQTDIALEVLIIDDHSSDNSFELAKDLARQDSRIRVFQTPRNAGPGGARNVGIQHMRGRWYAMLDCDDGMEPARSRTLIDAAEAAGADMIADDLQVFGEGIDPSRHLGDSFLEDAFRSGGSQAQPGAITLERITLERYFSNTLMFSNAPNLGFLKPVIRRSAFGDIRYRTDLRIGEDDELVIRLLLDGAHYAFRPQALYRYRKHSGSISHRLSAQNSALMVRSEEDIRAQILAAGQMSQAYRARYNSILDAAAFSGSVDALKSKDLAGAIAALIKRPSAARHFAMPIAARWNRMTRGA